MSDVPPLIPGSKLFNTLKVIKGTNITKASINSLVEFNEWKGLVDVATTSNIAFLSGNKVVDEVAVTQGYIVLVKNQAIGSQNGIYTVNSTGAWTRSNLLKTGSNAAGVAIFVKLGSVNLNKVFVCINEPLSAIVGTNDLVFESVVLNINNLIGTNGGIAYKDGSDFGVDTGTTDGAGNLVLSSLKSNGTILSGTDLISDEYSFTSAGKRIYYDSSLIKFDNGGSQVLELGSTLVSTVPIISNEYSFTGDTSISLGYTTGQVTVNTGSNEFYITGTGLTTGVEYYSGSSTSLSYQYSGTTSGIQNTESNDIDLIIGGTSAMKVGPSSIINTLDVVSPNFLFEGNYNNGFVQQGAKLVGSGFINSSNQGYATAIYEDTLVIGGPEDDTNIGAVWIFTRTAGIWSQQGSKLTTGTAGSLQGFSVSIYEDTIAVGGYNDDSGTGAVWIFTRTSGIWSQQGSKLVGTGASGGAFQGFSVSLYQDTVVFGGIGDDGNNGAVWVFTRTGSVWTQQGSKLIGTGAIGDANQGFSVSLYQDTLVIGGPQDNSGIGAIWVFTRSLGTWTQQGSKLVGTGAIGNANQGWSVSLYEDTLALGGELDDSGVGASWVFTRSLGTWTEQAKLIGSGSSTQQGSSISLYQDTLVVGGPIYDLNKGAVWVFTRSLGTWTQQGLLIGTGSIGNSELGRSISLYGDTLVTGGPADNSNTGAVWAFVYNFEAGSSILFNGNDIDFYLNGSDILSLNSTKTLSNVPITSTQNKYKFNDTDTKNVKFDTNVMTFKTNNVDILTVSSLAVSTSTSLLSDSYLLGSMGIVNSSNTTTVYNTDTSMSITSTALTTNKQIVANKYAFLNNENNYIGFTSGSIAFNLATTTSISLSQNTLNTSLPFTINSNYLSSPVLGTSYTQNISTSNNSLVLGGGLYTLNGSVSDFATAALLQLSLQTSYLVSGRIETNVPIVFKIQRNTSTVITNIQGTYSTYFTLTGSKLFFNSNYSNYSFSFLVNKSVT